MEQWIGNLITLVVALPLLAAVLAALLGPRILKEKTHYAVIACLAGSFVCSAILVSQFWNLAAHSEESFSGEVTKTLWTWASLPSAYAQPSETGAGISRDFVIDITLRVDGLTALMLAMVTFISTLVAIYSAGYMHGDRGYWRFFAYIGLFVFSMTMLVSVSNFLLLFVFWEAVGACSYLLIGFWYEKPEAAAAGKKAFLVNRVGDFGFMLAIFLIWTTYGTLNFHDPAPAAADEASAVAASPSDLSVEEAAPAGILGRRRTTSGDYAGGVLGLSICLLLMLGACGKSAQFPLHVWLPDAMEGPTPVSALIHAATMVTAGVYMVARCSPLFFASPDAMIVVAAIGAFTSLLAALIALTQFDLKRVLAYSTVSQLGYMFLALGVGSLAGITAGMFHLITHAFFKALLFLGAGSVMHAMGNVIDMRRFGGLRRLMPITYITFLCGSLALAGIPPLAGFWSKDTILGAVHDRIHHLEHAGHASAEKPEIHPVLFAVGHDAAADEHHEAPAATPVFGISPAGQATIYKILYWTALVVALLTAFYTFRAFFLTFYGEERVPHEAGHHAHESPPSMWIPLAILAFFAVTIGAYFEVTHQLSHLLHLTPSLAFGAVYATAQPYAFHFSVAATSTLFAAGGVLLAVYFYLGGSGEAAALADAMNFKWMNRVGDVQWVASLRRLSWVESIYAAASSVYLGWLARMLGQILLLVVLMLSAPLLLLSQLSPYRLSVRKFYWDEIYNALIVAPLKLIARLCYWVDQTLIDGGVNLLGSIPPRLGNWLRSLQGGLLQFYALAMLLGILVFVAARMLWAAG